MEPRDRQIPWAEVKKASREDLAYLMKKYFPGEQAWDVAVKVCGKMNLKDLCERATAEITVRDARTDLGRGKDVLPEAHGHDSMKGTWGLNRCWII